MESILSITGYRFVDIADPACWRDAIARKASENTLLGTVLVANEGINLNLAGSERALRRFTEWLKSHALFADLRVRSSRCESSPFGKLIVKAKAEIIRMNHRGVRPQAGRAPSVDARTLARWLDVGVDDTGRALLMLDTRNAFEVDHGRFQGALDWRIGRFSEFPQALAARRGDLAGATVVSYCTGGIRCEKAALLMAESGVPNVVQLDGGILRYLDEVGARHFEGSCFVFDAREFVHDIALLPRPV